MTTSGQATLVFVPLRQTHIEKMMPIELEAYPEPWTTGMFRDEIRNARSFFRVAYAHDDIVGYCGFWLVLDEAHITHVTVGRDFRGLGYGRTQVHHLLDEARKRGATVATLEVRETNVRARTLYESLGFAACGIRKGYYAKTNEDAIVMSKDLTV